MPSSNGPLHGTRNKLKNKPRERGTSPPQRAIQEYEVGERVHVKIDPSVPKGRPHARFTGMTGTVKGKQGRCFNVEINDGGKRKVVVVAPAHLNRQQA